MIIFHKRAVKAAANRHHELRAIGAKLRDNLPAETDRSDRRSVDCDRIHPDSLKRDHRNDVERA